MTLKPLERKILKDFQLSKFVLCTDGGLASLENRRFNDLAGRAFITTQSIKKLKDHLKRWALDPEGWRLSGDNRIYNISELDEERYFSHTFYKERWIKENGLEQRLIVTYSIRYKDYQNKIRERQINRALQAVNTNPYKIKKTNPNDYKRLIKKTNITTEGEVADKEVFSIDQDLIAREAQYDGFYAVCTNLEDDASQIIRINHRRWEIEECFRIMKNEFKTRPVYLSRDDRIVAHFTTCFLALVVYRFLEKKLENRFTTSEIIQGLRDMNFFEVRGEGYVPTYTRNDFTDALHDAFGFRTDYQIVTLRHLKKILKKTKS